ncbi:transporter substrate-binding domain-containing protein [Salinimicrobium catena]|uniref:transporter substrate-binding domain-containing protein n=1 Tax=Salinimicrobium catena TaxID=390640 RepID=UPI002FE4B04E
MRSIFPLLCFLLFNLSGIAQDSTQTFSEKLKIGLTEAPPFVMQENGRLKGLSISSWALVNRELESEFEYKVYPDLNSLLTAVENGDVDFSINPITVTDQRMKRMDFSQPYFISHTAIARRSGSKVWGYLSNMLSWNFISAILILVGVIFLFGFLVWIFERKVNKEEFGEGPRGILQGFWWSAVTMTTVGYGDKSPRTFGGRFIGLIWMFLAIIMISSLTAGIASSLTVQNIQDEITSIEDLGRFDVATVQSSSSLELLEQYNVESQNVLNAEEGIDLLLNKQTNLLVYDQPILNYLIEQKELEDELEVLPKTLKKDYFSYSFPKGSTLIKKIDPLLVGTLKSMEWNTLIKDYK